MGRGGKDGVHHVLFPGGHARDAAAAPPLGAVGAGREPLDIPHPREGIDALFLFDQVLDVDLVFHMRDLRPPIIAVFVADGLQLGFDDLKDPGGGGQNVLEIPNLQAQLCQLGFDLLSLQPLQPAQLHLQNGLGLDVADRKSLHQPLLGVVIAGADDVDDLVDVFTGDGHALKNMLPLLGLL